MSEPPNTQRAEGSFFGSARKYTRHIRPQDELAEDERDPDAAIFCATPPASNVPTVSTRKRQQLRGLDPTDKSFYEDPIMDYEQMPATSKEILQFTQDVTSNEFVAALKKKANAAELDELYLVADEEESHDAPEQPMPPSAPPKQTESKSKRRKKRRAQQRSQLLFQRVPKIPAVFDHFFHVRRDSRAKVSNDDYVKECMDALLPYLYWKQEDWIEQCLSCDDIKDIVCMTGMFYTNTYKRVEGCYTVHVYSDMQQNSDSQTLVYDILLFVVCKRVNKQCYCIKTFFFMKNEH